MDYKKNIKIFENPIKLSQNFSEDFIDYIQNKESVKIVLAGGSTPRIFYTTLAQEKFKNRIDWSKVHLFWGDERCVAPHDPDSNYRMVRISLLDHIDIPGENIHRIFGESNPPEEAQRYSEEILQHVPLENNLPKFDWILLGLGNDGHTASLFPNSEDLKISGKFCVVATHPITGQKRVSLTLPVLENAGRLSFLVTNKKKNQIMKKILSDKIISSQYPASLLYGNRKDAEWWLDWDAAELLHFAKGLH